MEMSNIPAKAVLNWFPCRCKSVDKPAILAGRFRQKILIDDAELAYFALPTLVLSMKFANQS